MKKRSNTEHSLEYLKERYHNDINEDSKAGRTDSVEKDVIHMNVDYKKRKVRVHLEFSKEQDHGRAEVFYDGLKKIYVEKMKLSL